MESKCPYKQGFGDVEDCPGTRPVIVSNPSKCCWQRSYRSFPCLVLFSFLLLVASVGVLLFIVTGLPTNPRRLVIEVAKDGANERDTASIGENVGGSDVLHDVMSLVEGNLREGGTVLVKNETNRTLARLLQLLKARVSRGTLGSTKRRGGDEESGNNIDNINVVSINIINSHNNNNNDNNDDDTEDSNNNVKYAKNTTHMDGNNVVNVERSFDGNKVGNDNNNLNNNTGNNIIIGWPKSDSNSTAAPETTTTAMTGAN